MEKDNSNILDANLSLQELIDFLEGIKEDSLYAPIAIERWYRTDSPTIIRHRLYFFDILRIDDILFLCTYNTDSKSGYLHTSADCILKAIFDQVEENEISNMEFIIQIDEPDKQHVASMVAALKNRLGATIVCKVIDSRKKTDSIF